MNAPIRIFPLRRVAIGLGSSIGDRRAHLARALQALNRTDRTELVRVSRLVRTPPMRGGRATGWFLNAVGIVKTSLSPAELLEVCEALEHASGRRRAGFWGDRTLDLDILIDEAGCVDEARLQVPHPALVDRRFVIEPLREVWPDAPLHQVGVTTGEWPSPPGPLPVLHGVLARPR